MEWVLVFMALIGTQGQLVVEQGDTYSSMTDCFEEIDKIVEHVGRPIVNYRVTCIQKDTSNPLILRD